jgi:hypothetical protein
MTSAQLGDGFLGDTATLANQEAFALQPPNLRFAQVQVRHKVLGLKPSKKLHSTIESSQSRQDRSPRSP